MNVKKNLTLAIAALAVVGAALPSTASAQVDTRRDRWDRYDYRPGRGDRRDWVVRPLVVRVERESNSFRAWFEKNYDRRRLGRERDNRWLKNEIQGMDEALERLRSRASDSRPGIGREQLEDALNHARRIDDEIGRDRDTRFTLREWDDLRHSLDDLARLYRVRGL